MCAVKDMGFQDVNVRREGKLGWLYISRPEARNALRTRTLQEVRRAVDLLYRDGQVKALIIRGEGGYFSSGGDIKEFGSFTPQEARRFASASQALLRRIETCLKPVVGCVEGFALGAGCDLALACDYTVAEEGVELGWPGVRLGIISPMGAVTRLVLAAGIKRAKMLLLTGQRISAAQALELGLIDEVTPRGKAAERSGEVAGALAEIPQSTLKMVKTLLRRGPLRTGSDGLERRLYAALFKDPAVLKLVRGFQRP